MARTRDLDWLIAQVRSRTDQEVDGVLSNANHIIPWINNGIAAFFEEMIEANPDWYVVTTTLATTGGTLEYTQPDIPVDMMAVRGVEYTTGGITISLEEFQWGERNHSAHPFSSSRINPRYRFMRNGIDGASAALVFRPDPGSRTYTIHYVPNPPLLEEGADLFDGIAGFEEYVIEFACILVRNKQEEDPAPHERLLAHQRERIQGLAHQRDMSGGTHIARVRRGRRRRVRRGFI